MSFSALLRRLSFALAVTAPFAAFAHPGHDGGHDLTWDFSGEVAHRLSSPYHLLPMLAAAGAFFLIMRLAKTRSNRAVVRRD